MVEFKILVVDDEEEFRDACSLILSDKGYEVFLASSGEEGLNALKKDSFDLVLTDLKMGGISGLEFLSKIREEYYSCEVIVVTGYSTVESAVTAIKLGAFGYFIKGQDPELLLKDIEKLVKIKSLEKDNNNIKYGLGNSEYLLSTNNEKFKDMLRIAEKSALSNSNILILGESGTGKEVIAKYIHQCSIRKDKNFIPVSCQVFSEGVLVSELFGHEKGAFTGAMEKRIGRFEEANNGTLFLDEIGELPLSTQTKLLRVIETRSIERIGSNKNINVNIRLISATNRKLSEEIKGGRFREDLFYRINTITLEIPPLRERKEDLTAMIKFFLIKFQREMKKEIVDIEDGLMKVLMAYDYPGNLRELRNIIERLVVLSENSTIREKDLPDLPSLFDEKDKFSSAKSLKDVRKVAEADYIIAKLKECNGNISEAARLINISRRQLFNKIVEYGIKSK